MKKTIAVLFFCCAALAEDAKPHPTVESLQAEIEHLKAQLVVAKLEHAYEMQVCTAPDLMAARLAMTKAEAAKAKPTSPKPAPKVP